MDEVISKMVPSNIISRVRVPAISCGQLLMHAY